MADLGNGPEQVGQFTDSEEMIAFTLEPIGDLPKVQLSGTDSTLDVPTFDIPEGTQEPTVETLEVEHELTKGERQELVQVMKGFEFTSTNKLGRTHLIEHEIVLKQDAKPKNQVMYRSAPAIQRE